MMVLEKKVKYDKVVEISQLQSIQVHTKENYKIWTKYN